MTVPLPTPEGPTIMSALINHQQRCPIQTVTSQQNSSIISIMENKQAQTSQRKETLQRYHSLTSPLVPLLTVQQQEQAKQEARINASMRLDYIKNRSSKVYALQTNQSFSDLKAGAIIYQVPQFSVPQINFQVADHIRRRVDEIKQEVITRLPEISRSSNYAPKKLEHQFNHRSAVKELQEWLKVKLKQPPMTPEDTIEYKNMIMGVGMKELIRIIGKRCNQEGRITEQIWELTWGICRQIILHLSKRAKKCEELLEEEVGQMRVTYQREYQRLKEESRQQAERIQQLEVQNKEFFEQLAKAKRRRQQAEVKNRDLSFDNFYLQEEFKKILEENLAIYLQIGDKSKRGWIKKMYKNISQTTNHRNNFQQIYQSTIANAIKQRNQLEQVTGDLVEPISKEQIKQIGAKLTHEIQKVQQKLKKNAKPKKEKRNKSTSPGNNVEDDVEGQQISSEAEGQVLDSSSDFLECENLINNMREEFLPIEVAVQTDKVAMIHAFASTPRVEKEAQSFNVSPQELNCTEETGVNTEEVRDLKQSKKAAGKQNGKEDKNRGKSKLLSSGTGLGKDKSRPKLEKEKKTLLEIVQEQHRDKSEPREEMVQSVRLSEQISYGGTAGEGSRQQGLNKVKTININNRNSQMTADKQPSLEREEEGRLTDSVNRNISRNKMVSIFNNQSSESQSFLNNSITGVERNSSPRTDKSSVANLYSQLPESIYQEPAKRVATEERSPSKGKVNYLEGLKDNSIFICANCNRTMTEEEPKYNPNSYKKNNQNEGNKRSKRSSQNSALNIASVRSFKKILCPIEAQEQQKEFEGRRVRKTPSRRSSGYIQDIAYKKEMEGQIRSLFNRGQEPQQKDEEEEENRLSLAKMSSARWLTTQLIDSNRDWINAIGYNQLQSSESLEQYLQMVKEILALPQGKVVMTQKAAISSIEKNVFPILIELLSSVRKSVKSNKIAETMRLFTSLPNIVFNRINRKYGVKILAVKHLKILLLAFKTAAKFTEKYKTLELMMFTDCKSPHSEDLFVYLLIMGLYDPNFSGTKSITHQQALTVRQVCEDNLSRERQVYGGDWWNRDRPENQNIDLNELLKSILTNYRLLKINRIQELGFLYLMLKKDQWLQLKDFVAFLDVFKMELTTKIDIVKKLLLFCDIRNREQKLGISQNMFAKFLISCETLSLSFLEKTLHGQISLYFREWQRFSQFEEKVFSPGEQKNKTSPQSRDEEEAQDNPFKASSAPEISDQSSKEHLIEEKQVIKSERIPSSLRHYSSLSYEICSYLENEEETRFLSDHQRRLVKRYLLVHMLEGELEETVGLVDYFSDAMLGLVCSHPKDYAIEKKVVSN